MGEKFLAIVVSKRPQPHLVEAIVEHTMCRDQPLRRNLADAPREPQMNLLAVSSPIPPLEEPVDLKRIVVAYSEGRGPIFYSPPGQWILVPRAKSELGVDLQAEGE